MLLVMLRLLAIFWGPLHLLLLGRGVAHLLVVLVECTLILSRVVDCSDASGLAALPMIAEHMVLLIASGIWEVLIACASDHVLSGFVVVNVAISVLAALAAS